MAMPRCCTSLRTLSVRSSAALRVTSLLLLAAGWTACASPARGIVSSPPGFGGFPTRSSDAELWAEAVLYTDHADRLGADLAGARVLPVALRVGTITAPPNAEERFALRPETLDARLFLQDGTVLEWTRPDAVPARGRVRNAATNRGLALSLVPTWENAEEGFLFFTLPPGVDVKSHYALTARNGVYREVDLNHSLLCFRVETPEGTREIKVGVRAEAYGGSR